MGKTYMDLGNLDEAASHFSQAIAIQPDLADAHFQLGLVRTNQGNIQDAFTHFQQVLQLNPSHREAQQNLTRLEKQLRE
jgi:tetratricopeptide (TPR) repeat protein